MAPQRAAAPPKEPVAELTVEQLAQETGMTVRNIRNHQSRGVLPPPEVRSRIGYYGPAHVARLRLIQEMQAEGFKLNAIDRLIAEYGGGADRFVDLRDAVTAPLADEQPEVVTREELVARFGTEDDALIERARKLGLLIGLGAERYEVPSPQLLGAAEQAVAMGIPIEAALKVVGKLERDSRSSARAFVELFLAEVWEPFDKDGRPEEGWAEIQSSIEALRPIALQASAAVFRMVLEEEMDRAFGETLSREGG